MVVVAVVVHVELPPVGGGSLVCGSRWLCVARWSWWARACGRALAQGLVDLLFVVGVEWLV